MITKSYSQVGQDLWVDEVLKGKTDGKFLDVGANHPKMLSNTYALEMQLRWTGILIDNDSICCDLLRMSRKQPVFEVDSTKFDFGTLPVKDFDYLSLDVDSATTDTLKKILKGGITFRCATVEHDSYRFGPVPRDAMRGLLIEAGYSVARSDVLGADKVSPFEDWWINADRL